MYVGIKKLKDKGVFLLGLVLWKTQVQYFSGFRVSVSTKLFLNANKVDFR